MTTTSPAPQPGHQNLAAALAALQSELPEVKKGETAEVQTRSGGRYSYSYADLTDCTEAIMPLLGKHGLSFSAKPTLARVDDEGTMKFVLNYILRHASGEEDSGFYPLPNQQPDGDKAAPTPQEIGSAITYARRYTLCAITGLAPGGDDDDAQSAQQAARRSAASPPPPVNWIEEADKATTSEDAKNLGRRAAAAGEFKGEVEAHLRKRVAELEAAELKQAEQNVADAGLTGEQDPKASGS